jgi:hypothetical protein
MARGWFGCVERFGPRVIGHRRLAELWVSMIYDYFRLADDTPGMGREA